MDTLSGNRTYAVAIGGVLTAIGAYLNQSMELGQMISVVTTCLIGIFLRKGVKKAEQASSVAE
jgi:hypothetical protein